MEISFQPKEIDQNLESIKVQVTFKGLEFIVGYNEYIESVTAKEESFVEVADMIFEWCRLDLKVPEREEFEKLVEEEVEGYYLRFLIVLSAHTADAVIAAIGLNNI